MSSHNSIRRTLVRSLLLGLGVLSLALGIALYSVARVSITRQFDHALLSKAKAIATLVEQVNDNKYEVDFADELMPEFDRRKSPEYFEVWGPDGQSLERSRSLGDKHLEQFSGTLKKPAVRELLLPDGRRGRALGIRFSPQFRDEEVEEQAEQTGRPVPAKAVIVVARDRKPIDHTLEVFLWMLIVGVVLLPLGGTAIVVLAVDRGLRPLRDLAQQVEAIGPGTLATRVDAAGAPAELRPIESGLNTVLERLDAAFAREKRFTSDVSHELKTPIAEATSALEVALKWPGDAALLASSSRQALEAVRQMQRLVSSLLAIARSDHRLIDVEMEDLELQGILLQLVSHYEKNASARGVEIVSELPEAPVRVRTAPVLLSSILGNLLQNAVEYSPRGSKVEVRLSTEGSTCGISVSNKAPDLTPQDVSVMFEPFWRKDASRTDSAEHSGLGLALVQSLCSALGWEICPRFSQEQVLTVELRTATVDFPGTAGPGATTNGTDCTNV